LNRRDTPGAAGFIWQQFLCDQLVAARTENLHTKATKDGFSQKRSRGTQRYRKPATTDLKQR